MHTRRTKTSLRKKQTTGVVTRAASSTLLGTRPKRTRVPSRIMLESLESEASFAHFPKHLTKSHHVRYDKPQVDKLTNKWSGPRQSTQRPVVDVDNIYCCLCRISIDYTDRDLFISKEEANDVRRKGLPNDLYDVQNNIIICDEPGCNRAYHQRCHFVPVLSIPRGSTQIFQNSILSRAPLSFLIHFVVMYI
jgi:hypothetical protein